MLGWRRTLLPAWVTKGVSEGRRAGDPQLAHGGGSRSPIRPSTVPVAAPSVHLSVHPGPQPGRAGRLAVMVCVCVCVVPLMTTRKILHYIQTSTLGFVTLLLNTAKHSSNRTRRSRGAASPGGAETPALGKESLKPTMEEGDGRGYTSQFPFTRPPGGSTEAVCAGRIPGRAALNPPGRAAPSSSRREDEVEGLALGRGYVGVPQVHHEHHTGTFLRGTWGMEMQGEGREAPPQLGIWGGCSLPGLLWAPRGFLRQSLLTAASWICAGSGCCTTPAFWPCTELCFPIPQQV